jgi:DNA polymerase III, alpha subunit
MTAAPAFFEIGTRTNFSFLEGVSHPEELVEAARRLCLPGLGVADRNTVAGLLRVHAQANPTGFRFQPGARLVFADGTPDILAYPQNRHGWGNLCRLLSSGNLRGEKGVCILHEEDLIEWGEDLLIAVAPTTEQVTGDSDLPGLLRRLVSRFGNRAYLALVPRYDGLDRVAFAILASMAETVGLALIASNEPLYHEAARRPLADIVTAIRTHVPIAEAGFRLAANAERYLKTGAEMAQLFRHYPQAIANTQQFFSRLSFSLDELRYQYPDESLTGETPSETLERLARSGAARRYPEGVPGKISTQIDYELALIREKQYEPYFLTVRNIIEFARSEGILCQGRGSAANSVVCYCLGITEVDPERTTLLFERFISTERDEPPDIDVDFEHEKREVVIQHIYERYGREHAGLAAAVSCYRARSAGREVAKAFGLSEDVQSALASNVWGWSAANLSKREAKRRVWT